MNVKRVKLVELTGMKYNPKSRVEKGRIKGLVTSMEVHGLIYPIAVTKDLCIIDGHRRAAAAKQLGWDDIPVLVVETDTPDIIFAEVNATAKRIRSFENLSIFLTNPDAVTVQSQRKFEKMREVLGLPLLKKMVKGGYAADAYDRAVRIMKFIGVEDPAYLKKIMVWFLNHSQAQAAIEAIIRGVSPAKIRAAIEENKELIVTVV